MPKIDEIRKAATEYGRRSVENMQICERLGRRIIEAFDRFLKPEGGLVIGVTPKEEWHPEQGDYSSAAFSFYHDGILNLNEVQFGLAVRIDHLTDNGHFWVRLVVALRKNGDKIGVLAGDQDIIWLPINYEDADVQNVCEGVYEILLRVYRDDVNLFVQGRENLQTIGFRDFSA